MSVDVSVSAPGCCAGHSFNFTYNYTPLLRELGLPSWKMLDRHRADCLAVMLGRAYLELHTNHAQREYYEGLIRGGGEWGTVKTLLEQMQELLRTLDAHPDGTVFTSG